MAEADKKNLSKVISRDEVLNCETWKIPVVENMGGDDESALAGSTPYLTAQQLEKIQKQAFDEAFQQGMQQGVAAGEQLIKQRLANFESIMNLLAEPVKELNEEVQNELVNLCIALLKQLVRRELKLVPGQVVAVVRDSLSALPINARHIQIRLHPEDALIVKEALGAGASQHNWQVFEDPVISPGGCKIVTKTSQIDATLEARIAQLITEVFGGERASDQKKKQ